MGVASLVLGIVSIVFVVFTGGVASPVAAVLGIVGIVLGGLARRDNPTVSLQRSGMLHHRRSAGSDCGNHLLRMYWDAPADWLPWAINRRKRKTEYESKRKDEEPLIFSCVTGNPTGISMAYKQWKEKKWDLVFTSGTG